jgi:hypothetical protein
MSLDGPQNRSGGHTEEKYLASTGTQTLTPRIPARNQSLYRLRHTACVRNLTFFFFFIFLIIWFVRLLAPAATPGLLCQPRVIVKMIVEKQMECRLAGGTEILGENLPQCHFCPSQNPT